MSRRSRFEPDRPDLSPPLGAIELTSFDQPAANDNNADGAHGVPKRAPKPAGFALPAVAIASGLTAALIVTGLSHLFGFTA